MNGAAKQWEAGGPGGVECSLGLDRPEFRLRFRPLLTE